MVHHILLFNLWPLTLIGGRGLIKISSRFFINRRNISSMTRFDISICYCSTILHLLCWRLLSISL